MQNTELTKDTRKAKIELVPQLNAKRGFTLIEILVAIGILGLVASVAYINFDNARARARDHQRKEDLKAIKTALLGYYQDHDGFPPPCNPGPCTQGASLPSNSLGNWIPGLTPTYIAHLPNNPLPTSDYLYIVPADRSSFILWAALERENDPDIYDKPRAGCRTSPPSIPFNYCLESPE